MGCTLAINTQSRKDNQIVSSACRYCYKNQIEVVQWNLAQFATALLACDLCAQEAAQEAINSYGTEVLQRHNSGMAAKLGLQEYDENMVTSFLRLMYTCEADFTNTFRALSHVSTSEPFERIPDGLTAALGKPPDDAQTKVCMLLCLSLQVCIVWSRPDCVVRHASNR